MSIWGQNWFKAFIGKHAAPHSPLLMAISPSTQERTQMGDECLNVRPFKRIQEAKQTNEVWRCAMISGNTYGTRKTSFTG